MSQHYNVDKIVRQFQRSIDAAVLPDGAPAESHIQHRHRHIHAQFLRLILSEKNNGAGEVSILAAVAGIVANALSNAIRDLPPQAHSIATEEIIKDVKRQVTESLSGGEDRFTAAKFEFEPEIGGHA